MKPFIAAVPLVVTPIRPGIISGTALAGHPATTIAGFAVDIDGAGTPTWMTTVALQRAVQELTGAVVVMSDTEIVQRRNIAFSEYLIRAEDICRMWGEHSWCSATTDAVATSASEPARRRVLALCRGLSHHLSLVADLLTPIEYEAYKCHREVGERGIHIETKLAGWLRELIRQREHQRQQTIGKSFASATLTVTKALTPGGPLDRMLHDAGLTLKNRSEDALLELVESGRCKPYLQDILQALIGHGRIAKAKVERILASVDKDHRLRHQLVMWAARTWRFSSQDTQIQNIPKPVKGLDYPAMAGIALENIETVAPGTFERLSAIVPGGQVDDAFPAYLRMCFSAPPGKHLLVLDWNAIEPRIRAWLSDDQEHLKAWRDGRDLYSELISGIVGRTISKASDNELRNVGKVADIGCGYQMSASTFSDMCTAFKVNLKKLKLTPETVVSRYRTEYSALSHPRSGLWARLHAGAIQAVQEGSARVGHLSFERTGKGHLDFILPNGSRRRWWKAEVQMRPPKWAKAGDRSQDKPVVMVARTPDGTVDEVMYGGRILENACQAIGREILVEYLVKLSGNAHQVVAHCHDEVVIEAPSLNSLATMKEVVRLAETTPSWAKELPLKVEAFHSYFWAKEPPFEIAAIT